MTERSDGYCRYPAREAAQEMEIDAFKLTILDQEREIERLKAEAGYHDAKDVIQQLTENQDTLLKTITTQEQQIAAYRSALDLIASPKRPDGTYNRSREACERVAKEALDSLPAKAQGKD